MQKNRKESYGVRQNEAHAAAAQHAVVVTLTASGRLVRCRYSRIAMGGDKRHNRASQITLWLCRYGITARWYNVRHNVYATGIRLRVQSRHEENNRRRGRFGEWQASGG